MYKRLPVVLDAEELAVRADSLAEKINEAIELESEMKASASNFKDRLKAYEMQIAQLATTVHTRNEYREVMCKEVRNDERMTMDTVRLDTDEIVETRAMEKSERTAPLPFVVPEEQVANKE